MNLLLVVGAGTSIELGVPAMTGLAEEFLDHTRQWSVEADLVQHIIGSTLDIEHLIEEIDRICAAKGSLSLIGGDADQLGRFDKVRAEVEWFIQHAAERVRPRDAHLMWASVLRAFEYTELTIVSTNYDRAIELAANAEGIAIDDGFGDFGLWETASWQGFSPSPDRIKLVKLHGSTDWYSDSSTGQPTKLRHPMPLFGRASLRLSGNVELGSALILPSREKLLTREPYPRLSQAFLNAADGCDVGIVVGSSLRDHHLRGAVQTIAARAPTFIVNPEGDTRGIEGAVGIPQVASAFLVGTLAKCLMSEDPSAALRAASTVKVPRAGTLRSLRTALDRDQTRESRCEALERLDAMSTSLDAQWLAYLLADEDAHVARYALSLIPLAAKAADLAMIAKSSPHASADGAYQEDLQLMETTLGASDGRSLASQQ